MKKNCKMKYTIMSLVRFATHLPGIPDGGNTRLTPTGAKNGEETVYF